MGIPWWRSYLCDPNLEGEPSIGKTFAIRAFRSLTVAFGRERTPGQTRVVASVVSRMGQDAPGQRARSQVGIAGGTQKGVGPEIRLPRSGAKTSYGLLLTIDKCISKYVLIDRRSAVLRGGAREGTAYAAVAPQGPAKRPVRAAWGLGAQWVVSRPV